MIWIGAGELLIGQVPDQRCAVPNDYALSERRELRPLRDSGALKGSQSHWYSHRRSAAAAAVYDKPHSVRSTQSAT